MITPDAKQNKIPIFLIKKNCRNSCFLFNIMHFGIYGSRWVKNVYVCG